MENQLLGNILNNIVIEKAVRDKIAIQQKQQREEQAKKLRKQRKMEQQYDELDEFDDEETKEIMRKMREQRFKNNEELPVKKVQEKRSIGEYREIMENQFLNWVTKLKYTVVHFYHKEFQRCKILDKHLKILCQQFPNTQFLTINAQKAPFFVQKLGVRTLPTLCIFINGVLKDKVLGFDGLSGDEFLTYELAAKLAQSGVIQSPKNKIKDKTLLKGQSTGYSDEEEDDN